MREMRVIGKTGETTEDEMSSASVTRSANR